MSLFHDHAKRSVTGASSPPGTSVGSLGPAGAPTAATREHPPLAKLVAAFAAVYILWGSTFLAIRFAVATLPPFLMAGTRHLIAGAILYPLARLHRTSGPHGPTEKRGSAGVCGLMASSVPAGSERVAQQS